MRNLSSTLKLVIAILACEVIGFTSGLIGSAAMNTWFDNLQKPSWNPPGFLFAPVWTLLYALMGIAFWLIWKNESPEANKRSAYFAFALQLFLNFWWSIIFFRFQSPFFALIEILLLLAMILHDAVETRLGCHIHAIVRQSRYDLMRRQTGMFRTIHDFNNRCALCLCQLMGWLWPYRARPSIRGRVLPTLVGPQRDTQCVAGFEPSSPGRHRFFNQGSGAQAILD